MIESGTKHCNQHFNSNKQNTTDNINYEEYPADRIAGRDYDKLRTDRLSKETDPFSREQIKKSFGGTTDKK